MRYGMFYDYDRYARFLRASFTMRKRGTGILPGIRR